MDRDRAHMRAAGHIGWALQSIARFPDGDHDRFDDAGVPRFLNPLVDLLERFFQVGCCRLRKISRRPVGKDSRGKNFTPIHVREKGERHHASGDHATDPHRKRQHLRQQDSLVLHRPIEQGLIEVSDHSVQRAAGPVD